jgi:hypothetical protein
VGEGERWPRGIVGRSVEQRREKLARGGSRRSNGVGRGSGAR